MIGKQRFRSDGVVLASFEQNIFKPSLAEAGDKLKNRTTCERLVYAGGVGSSRPLLDGLADAPPMAKFLRRSLPHTRRARANNRAIRTSFHGSATTPSCHGGDDVRPERHSVADAGG